MFIFLNSINLYVLEMKTQCGFCEVQTEYINSYYLEELSDSRDFTGCDFLPLEVHDMFETDTVKFLSLKLECLA